MCNIAIEHINKIQMKLLHVVNIYFVVPYFLGNQLKYFKEKGYEEHIICSPSDEMAGYAADMGFQYEEFPVERKISIVDDLRAVWKTARYIRRHKIDVVTGHTPKGGLIAMLAAWLTMRKTRIYFRHGLVYETSKGIKRALLINIDRLASALATKVVCVSPSVMRRSIEDKLAPAKKQLILGNGTCNGINIERFTPAKLNAEEQDYLKAKFGIQKGDFVIGYVGRMVRDKGIIELIEAFDELTQTYKNVKILLVGMLETRDALPQNVIGIINNHPNIIHAGYVDYRQIEKMYGLMSVYVLPSYREGFPTSVLEASAMQLPVITTRVTGCCDSIEDGATGLFINNNSHELYQALEKLIANPELCRTLGTNGRKVVEDKFDERVVWPYIEQLYK